MLEHVRTLGDHERKALSAFCDAMHERFGHRVRDIVLFGSRARGEGDEDSDLDVLVTVTDLTPNEGWLAAGDAGDVLTTYDVLIAPLVVSTSYFDDLHRRERRIALEIGRDGVRL